MGEKADYYTYKGTVTYIKHDNDPWYPACPTDGCNKKVRLHRHTLKCRECMIYHTSLHTAIFINYIAFVFVWYLYDLSW